MLGGKLIGVSVPAYKEERFIADVIGYMPDFVDKIIVVNDGSPDDTGRIIDECAKTNSRVHPVHHESNQGLGQSLIDGYLEAKTLGMDIVAVMAGDGQMSPNDLETVVRPIVSGRADYVKGNRLLRDEVIDRMPRHRLIGNAFLSLLSKFATGYWKSMDPQCGYTAISARALSRIPIKKMIKGYGYNAHILNMLNLANQRVAEVEVEPVYRDETSYIKLRSYIPTVSRLLVRLFWRRLFRKYVVRDFHPLALMYLFSITVTTFIISPLLVWFSYHFINDGIAPQTSFLTLAFTSMFAVFSLFFAMWLDMEDNRRLWVDESRTDLGPAA
jgi:glycosyltransferase involved in cell wall biosynthesis